MKERKLTGYPSIDKPWLKYYEGKISGEMLVPGGTVYDFLWQNNSVHPKDIALRYFWRKIDYRKLFSKIDDVERALTAYGVKAGEIVTIALPSIPEVVYLFYALAKIGAIANMIDPRLSEEELRWHIAEAGSKVVFLLSSIKANSLQLHGVETIVMVSPLESLLPLNHKTIPTSAVRWNTFLRVGKGGSASKTPCEAERSVLMTHTSGTTGYPKGVLLANNAINALAVQYQCVITPKRGDSYLCVIPPFIAFGVCVAIHMPLSLGVTTVLIPQFNAGEFGKILKKYRPNHFTCTPTNFEPLLQENSKMDLDFIKTPAVGGDSMNEEFEQGVNEYLAAHGCKHKVVKGYGMSEVGSSACTCWDDCNSVGSVGIPLPQMTISIFKPGSGEELPYNDEGEICFSGPSMMQGYFKNESATKSVLWKHEDGRLWMHSGDVGYMTEDGMLFVIDRIKRLIRVDVDHCILPSKIERPLKESIEVRTCAVVGLNGDIFAFIVLNKECDIEQKTLISRFDEWLAGKIPTFAMPKKYVFCDALPLTPVGKVDYRTIERMIAGEIDNDYE